MKGEEGACVLKRHVERAFPVRHVLLSFGVVGAIGIRICGLGAHCPVLPLRLLVGGKPRELVVDPDPSDIAPLWDAELAEGFFIAVEDLTALERDGAGHNVCMRWAAPAAQDRRLHRCSLHVLDASFCLLPFSCSWAARAGAKGLRLRGRALLGAPNTSARPSLACFVRHGN